MRKEVKVNVAGRPYLIRQMAAREGFDYMDRAAKYDDDGKLVRPSLYTAEDMTAGVKVLVDGQWVAADSDEVIDAYVSDVAALIPPYKVLGLVHKEVNVVNFGFLHSRKQPRVPRRFKAGIDPLKVDLIDPTIAHLVASGKATMAELDSVYSVQDAFMMADILVTDNVNQALAQEAAIERAKSKR